MGARRILVSLVLQVTRQHERGHGTTRQRDARGAIDEVPYLRGR